MTNQNFYADEMMNDEQLDLVRGGIATELIVAGLTIAVERGISEAGDIKDLINSDAYKNMSGSDKNKRLGKELANSFALCGIFCGLCGVFGGVAVGYAQVKWRTSGTSDGLRGAIESMFQY